MCVCVCVFQFYLEMDYSWFWVSMLDRGEYSRVYVYLIDFEMKLYDVIGIDKQAYVSRNLIQYIGQTPYFSGDAAEIFEADLED